MPEQDNLDPLREACRNFSLTEGGSHGPDHSERVLQTSLYLGKRLSARLDILGPAALLHDIGRREESLSRGSICHAQRSAELAAPILTNLQYCAEDIATICQCIRTHRYRRGAIPVTLEEKILFDADKLDSIGAIGIGRAFLFAGQIGARLHNPEVHPAHSQSYSLEDTAYREFQVKMSKIKDLMLTDLGKKLARKRHAFMETFFTQLSQETSGIFD